jgi:alpha-D-xyloside xylohydrolase
LTPVLGLFLLGCGDDQAAGLGEVEDEGRDTAADAPVAVADFEDRGDEDPGDWSAELVAPSGEVLTIDSDLRVALSSPPLELSLADLAFGSTRELSTSTNYDPTFLFEPPGLAGPAVPPDLIWSAAESAVLLEGDRETLTIDLLLSDGSGVARLSVSTAGDGTFRFDLQPPENLVVVYTRVSMPINDTEGLYGLGELFDRVELRGALRPMQFQLEPEIESSHNEVHVPVPFIVSTRGWGFFIESHEPGVFDVARESPDRVVGVFNQEALTLYLYAAPDPLGVIERHSAVAGRIPMPPPWTLGMWLWRNENRDSAEVIEDARALREHGIASSAIWLDRPWQSYHESFDFDEARFDNPDDLIDELHGLGFRVAVWTSPYVARDSPVYEMVRDNGWLVTGDVFLNPFGIPVDFTVPEAMTWWQERVRTLHERGIEGFKLDYGQDIQVGLGGARIRYTFANGEDERTMHHRYTDLYHIAHDEPIGYDEGFFIARSGTYEGMQYITCIWPGDLDNSFAEHGVDSHVGGLPAGVFGGISLSASGYPLYASDTGGYRHGRASREVLMRWIAYSWLLPIMQLGGSSDHNPWNFDNYDEETLEVVRGFANLHMRWFPYFYSLVERAHETGRPINPPFGLAWPTAGMNPDDQFAVGDALMAAPVITDQAGRDVVFPAGRWVSWWDGAVTDGPTEVTVAVPYDQVPLYLGEGAIVPMLWDRVDTLSPVEGDDVVSWVDQPGRLWTRIVPADGASFTVHDGTWISVTVSEDGAVTVEFTLGDTYDGHILEVWSDELPATVTGEETNLTRVDTIDDLDSCDGCWTPSDWGILIHPDPDIERVKLTW